AYWSCLPAHGGCPARCSLLRSNDNLAEALEKPARQLLRRRVDERSAQLRKSPTHAGIDYIAEHCSVRIFREPHANSAFGRAYRAPLPNSCEDITVRSVDIRKCDYRIEARAYGPDFDLHEGAQSVRGFPFEGQA